MFLLKVHKFLLLERSLQKTRQLILDAHKRRSKRSWPGVITFCAVTTQVADEFSVPLSSCGQNPNIENVRSRTLAQTTIMPGDAAGSQLR